MMGIMHWVLSPAVLSDELFVLLVAEKFCALLVLPNV